MAMVNYPYNTSFINPMPAWPVHVACDNAMAIEINTQMDSVQAIFEATNVYSNYSGWDTDPCLDLYGDSGSNALDGNGWDVLYCNEMVMPFA